MPCGPDATTNNLIFRNKNISQGTLELPQSRSTALPRHQKKERWGTNKEKTIATYETTDAQKKKNCNRGNALERSVVKLLGGGGEWGGGMGELKQDLLPSALRKHAYLNILKISPPKKKKKISDKNSDIFSYFCSQHRLGGSSNEYPQSMFLSRNKKKIMYTLVNPSFTI